MSLDLQKYLNVYQFSTVLPGSGKKIKLSPITTAQMKRLLSAGTEDAEAAIDVLLNSCVVDPPEFDVRDLYLEDRIFLLLELRKKTKGHMFRTQTKCDNPKCGAESLTGIDLNKLKIIKLGKLENVVELDAISVSLKYITRAVEIEAETLSKAIVNDFTTELAQQIKQAVEEASLKYALCIEKIKFPDKEVEPTIEEKIEFINGIPSGLYDKIKDWFTEVKFGVDFKIDIKCDLCKTKRTIEVPLEGFLF